MMKKTYPGVKNSIVTKWATILLAFYIDIPVINIIITRLKPSLASYTMTAMYVLFVALVIVLVVLNLKKMKHVTVNIPFMIVASCVFIYYLLTCFVGERSTLTTINFILFTVIPLFLPLLFDYDSELLMKALMIFH